ncbi:MAG: MFS transporter [Acidobacteria bacterium]|nr:MFS transporter [Acidobacteriota bacterium]
MRSDDHPVRAYLMGFVLIGVVLSIAGPSLSHLRDRMGTDNGGIAVVFVGSSVGYILGSTLAGRGLDHGRGHRRWVASMVLCTVSILAVAAAPNMPLLVAAFVVLGGTCGLGDVSGNTLVLWSRPDGPGPLLNALHLCFAVGAVFAPALVWLSLHFTESLWPMVFPVGALTAAFGVQLLRHPSPVRTRLETVERSAQGGARTLHVVMLCAFYFSYVALETGFAGWIHSYTEQIGYGTGATATGMITTFWVGFMLGRLASIWVSRRVPAGALVGWAMALSVVAALLFLLFRSAGPMLWVVTFLFAVSIAPQYASMMAFAEQHLALSGRNTSVIVASSGIGGLFMPWLLGQLFDARGPQSLPVVMVVLAAVTAVVSLAVGRMLVSAQRPPATSSSAPVT